MNTADALVEKAIRRRAMICFALCAVTRAEVQAGQLERATSTLETIRRHLEEINFLTADANFSSSVREISELLVELDRTVWAIQREIGRAST